MRVRPWKYTSDFVLKELNSMLKDLENDKEKEIVFKGQLFLNRDYSRQRFSEWAKDFEDDLKITEAIKKIDDILETRLVMGGLNKKLDTILTIFCLKNNYGWVDKHKFEGEGLSNAPIIIIKNYKTPEQNINGEQPEIKQTRKVFDDSGS
jgi:hypothetical protein